MLVRVGGSHGVLSEITATGYSLLSCMTAPLVFLCFLQKLEYPFQYARENLYDSKVLRSLQDGPGFLLVLVPRGTCSFSHGGSGCLFHKQ